MLVTFQQIPADNGLVEVTAEGHGVAVAQLSVCYNIPDSPFDEEPFDCVSQVSGKGLDSATVDFCCKLVQSTPANPDTEGTG